MGLCQWMIMEQISCFPSWEYLGFSSWLNPCLCLPIWVLGYFNPCSLCRPCLLWSAESCPWLHTDLWFCLCYQSHKLEEGGLGLVLSLSEWLNDLLFWGVFSWWFCLGLGWRCRWIEESTEFASAIDVFQAGVSMAAWGLLCMGG